MRFLFSILKRILDNQILTHELYKMKEFELSDFFKVTDKGRAFLDDFNSASGKATHI